MKRKIRLTESTLHKIVKESVNKIMNEAYQDSFNSVYYQVEQAYYDLDKAMSLLKNGGFDDTILQITEKAYNEVSHLYHVCRQRQEIGD